MVALGLTLGAPGSSASATKPITTVIGSTPVTADPPKADPAKTRRIIVVAPTSGTEAAQSADISKAARLAIRHAVEDGLVPADHGIEIIEFDQSAKNSGSGAVGRRLQKEPTVVAVIGGTTTNAVEDLMPVTSANKTAFLSFAATNPPTAAADSSGTGALNDASTAPTTTKLTAQKAVHLQLAADTQQSATTAAQRIDVAPGPVVTLHDGSTSGRLFVDTYIGVSASRFVPTIEMGQLPVDEKAFQKQADKVLSKSPRFIVFGGSAQTAARLGALVQAVSPATRILTGGSNSADCHALVASFRENDLCVLGWNPVSTAKQDKAFREDFLAVYQRSPVGHAANAYRSVKLLIAGLKPSIGVAVDAKQRSAGVLRQDLNARLANAATFQGLNIAFDPSGRITTNPSAVLVKQRNAWVSSSPSA